MRLALTLALLSWSAFAGEPVQFCVGSLYGSVSTCAPTFAGLGSEQDGELFALDKVGNSADWGLFCSWRGVRLAGVGTALTIGTCDESKRRLDDAADSLTRTGLVQAGEWQRVIASTLSGVLIYPSRVLEVPRGEEFVAGVYVPASRTIHLTSTLEGAPHELFHAMLATRGGSIDHDAFNARIDHLSRAFRARYRGRLL